MYNFYDDFLGQMKLPSASVTIVNGEIVVQNGSDSKPIDSYLKDAENHEQYLLTELHTFLELGSFTFTGGHNAFGNKDQKNHALEQQLESLVAKMSQASNLRDLERFHSDAKGMLGKMQSGRLGDNMPEAIHYLDSSAAMSRVGDDYHLNNSLVSGASIDMIKQMISGGFIERSLIEAYVDAMFESKKQHLVVENESKRVRSNSTQPSRVDSPITVSPSPDNVEIVEKEKDSLVEQRKDLIERRDDARRRKEELLALKQKMEREAETYGLFEKEEFENPIYREHLNSVDPDIIGHETETRYTNGSDDDRKQFLERMKKVEQDLKKIEEEIEVLNANIQQLDSKIGREAVKSSVDEPSVVQERSRFYGFGKLNSAIKSFFGKKPQKKSSELQELLEVSEEENDHSDHKTY